MFTQYEFLKHYFCLTYKIKDLTLKYIIIKTWYNTVSWLRN